MMMDNRMLLAFVVVVALAFMVSIQVVYARVAVAELSHPASCVVKVVNADDSSWCWVILENPKCHFTMNNDGSMVLTGTCRIMPCDELK